MGRYDDTAETTVRDGFLDLPHLLERVYSVSLWRQLTAVLPGWGQPQLGANLAGAGLQTAIPENANLENANLRDTLLWNANLCGANLTGADLMGADLHGGTYNALTKWPEGFDPVATGAILLVE